MKKSLSILFLSTLLLTSCFEGGFTTSASKPSDSKVVSEDISIDILNENTTLTVGDIISLEIVTDDNLDHDYIITSTDEDIILINDNDELEAKSSGNCTIYVSLKDDDTISSSIDFKVVEKKNTNDDIVVDDDYKLVFSDEFDGDSLNEEYWSYQEGTGSEYGLYGWGNQEAQSYKKENVTVKDGNLIITAKKENADGKSYTSGRIRSYNKVFKTYGRLDARMSLPSYSGLWPAFWLLPNNSTYGNWPNSGEIDIMEARGRINDEVSAAVHMANQYNQHTYQTQRYSLSDGDNISNYHVYSLIWEKNDLTFLVDDVVFMHLKQKTLTNYEGNEGQPFDTDFYILFNLAVGGSFDNYIMPSDDSLPASMKVDYIRWYQKG